MNIPYGTTHVILPNELDFDPKPDFMKYGPSIFGPESCKWIYAWFWWNGKEWKPEQGFCIRGSRKTVLVNEYIKSMYNNLIK